MSNEVTKQESQVPSTHVKTNVEEVLKSDVVIPKVLLMQGLSDFVSERKAIAGDMVRSSTAEKLGDDKTPIDIIPLTFQNLWMISENASGDGKKYEFRGYEPRTAATESLEWDFIKNGTKWKRTKVLNLFALLPADIEAQNAELKKFQETGEIPDVDKVLLPVVIPFRNTSFKAGKEVATLFAKAESISRQVGKTVPAYGTTISLSCAQDKNDKGTFFVFKATTAGKTNPAYRDAAATWYETLTRQEMKVAVDESDVVEAASEPANGPSQF